MAFSFTSTNVGSNIQSGPNLEEIQTNALGFTALSGESKVQLLSSSWPSDNLPSPTSSLLSIASRKGLVAAAGPDSIIVATTVAVRQAFDSPDTGNENVKPFQPQLKLPMSMRISQLAFSADEAFLILSAEVGGGLAVYDVQSLLQGSTQTAFELPTNGQSLRALVPNPTPEKAELLAIILDDGNLLMADLNKRTFLSGPNGQTLKSGVSCVSWSTKGKQLIAGLRDGTSCQMTPEGQDKGELPKPPGLTDGFHVSSITWLENNIFLLIHTPTNFDNSQAPTSEFHILKRQLPDFVFQKLADPAEPFGLNRSPPHHYLLRLKDFPPSLQDLLIVASTASSDIGLFSRSQVPLTNDKPADKIVGNFTMTSLLDDSRRAQLPVADLNDTSPIGLALDLSSKETVVKPIPSDEIDESPSPLPALMVLNNEGVLAGWWVVYADSIRQNTKYPGLTICEGTQASTQGPAAPVTTTAPASAWSGESPTPAFESSKFGSPSTTGPAFGTPASATSTFGSSAFGATPTLGQNVSGSSAFGAAPILGKSQSPWGNSSSTPTSGTSAGTFGSTFGAASTTTNTPAFGQTNTPAFGNSSLIGNRASPWGSTNSTTPTAAFGQASSPKPGIFGSASSTSGTTPASGGFAAFASQGGFAAAAAAAPSAVNVFATKHTASPFAPQSASDSVFGAPSQGNAKTNSAFGSNNFVLGSTFKADESSRNDTSGISNGGSKSFFGDGFGNALGETARPSPVEATMSEEAEMDTEEDIDESSKNEPKLPLKSAFPAGGIFGTPATVTQTPPQSVSTSFNFEKPPIAFEDTAKFELTDKIDIPRTPETPKVTHPKHSDTGSTPVQEIKSEPRSDSEEVVLKSTIPESPLPPDPTSSSSYPVGESSNSSINTDAPLPPDFIAKMPSQNIQQIAVAAVPKQDAPAIPANLTPPDDIPDNLSEKDNQTPPNSLPLAEAKPPSETSTLTDVKLSSGIPRNPVGNEEEKPTQLEEPTRESSPESPSAQPLPPVDESEGSEDDGEDSGDFLSNDENEDHSDDLSEEGSGEDIAKDLSPSSTINQTPSFTPQGSFGGPSNKASDSSQFMKIQKPSQISQGDISRSLFGEIDKSAPILPPPKMQASPRSPSPVRSALPGRMFRPETQTRSVSSPGLASQILSYQRTPGNQHAASQNAYIQSLEQQRREQQLRAEAKARKETEEAQALIDEDDEIIQSHLASALIATKSLDEFQSNTDYSPQSIPNSIPAQVDRVYRDINSMIDTLGVNARALACFIKGHTELVKSGGRHREDLEGDDDWCLLEMEDLTNIVEKELTQELTAGGIKDEVEKIESCNELQKDLIKLRAKHEDIKKILAAQSDPNYIAVARAQPLSAEQSAQQHDIRRDFTKFQKLLSEAEETLTVLKAKIASQTTINRASGSSGPTVEAVMRTITKMTAMAEKRSGDIDVLEGQMRKMRLGSVASNGSREGSPFSTPQNHKSPARNAGRSSTYGLFHTPEMFKDTSRNLQNSMMSSTSSHTWGSPGPRKKMSGYTVEEKSQLKMKLARRKEVTNNLKTALQKAGTNVRLMPDDDY